MRLAPIVLGLIASAAAVVVACREDNVVPGTGGGTITINPVCGSAGQLVTIIVPQRGGTCGDHRVRFHPGVEVGGTTAAGASGQCVVTATVPEAARTGTVEVAYEGEAFVQSGNVYATSGPFTIPCPGDAAPPDSSPDGGPGVDSGEPVHPLNAVWVHRRYSNSNGVNTDGFTYPTTMTPAQAAEVAKRDALASSELSPPGVAVGTCAPVTLPEPGAEEPKPICRGKFSVKTATSTVIDGINCGPDFHYKQTYTWASFYEGVNDGWEIAWEGDRAEPGFSIPNAVSRIHPLLLTSPNPATPDVDVPQAAFNVTWSPTLVQLMTLYFLRASGTPIACAVDPKAGTFTVPASVIGGPGELAMYVSAGDLRRIFIAQIAHAIMTMSIHNYEFYLHVQ